MQDVLACIRCVALHMYNVAAYVQYVIIHNPDVPCRISNVMHCMTIVLLCRHYCLIKTYLAQQQNFYETGARHEIGVVRRTWYNAEECSYTEAPQYNVEVS